ncbi:MAG: hypothetical protein AB1560_12860 [Pseudomonadota bacterium]
MNGVKFGEISALSGGGNPELSLGPFFRTVSWSLCVAVRAQETEVFQPVVLVVPVDVVKLQGYRLVEPSYISAIGATMLKNTFSQQSVSEFVRLKGQGVTKIFLDRLFRGKCLALAPGLTNEVRGVEIEMPDCFSQHVVIAAVGGDTEYL